MEKEEKRGRPAHEVTDGNKKLVKVLSGIGLTQAQIASKLDISVDTLTAKYRTELDLGKADAVASIADTLFKKARNGDNACMFFFLKTQGRWKENHDDTDANGQKVVVIRGGFPENA
jgi:hypothetical protein